MQGTAGREGYATTEWQEEQQPREKDLQLADPAMERTAAAGNRHD